jgi:hypothetical protein
MLRPYALSGRESARQIAEALAGKADFGNGDVHRIARAVARRVIRDADDVVDGT